MHDLCLDVTFQTLLDFLDLLPYLLEMVIDIAQLFFFVVQNALHSLIQIELILDAEINFKLDLLFDHLDVLEHLLRLLEVRVRRWHLIWIVLER